MLNNLKWYKLMQRKELAFSLIEMLMALLVASLLLAALAPVMTRKMSDSEIKVMSEASNYDKDLVISVFNKDTDFNIPIDANQVRVTLMGGGGKGGDALYGNKEFTSSQSFTIPDNVDKIRVFMVGAGGGGASSIETNHTVYGSIPSTTETYQDYTTTGETKLSSFPKSGYGAPAIPQDCITYGGITKWTLVANESVKVAPNSIAGSSVKITACGAGGGGGGGTIYRNVGGGGGSGGYLANVSVANLPETIYIKIPGGGGAGGYQSMAEGGYSSGGASIYLSTGANGGTYGGKAGNSMKMVNATSGQDGTGTLLSYGGGIASYGSTCCKTGMGGRGAVWGGGGGGGGTHDSSGDEGGGGGGGGPTTISDTTGTGGNLLFQTGGGGGGSGGALVDFANGAAGSPGGGGGGYGGGGGAGGSGNYSAGTGGSGGTYLSAAIGGGTGNSGISGSVITTTGYNGKGGGGGYGGVNGTNASTTSPYGGLGGVISNSIFNGNTYCSGGNGAKYSSENFQGATPGKQGALRLYYGGAGKSNVFKCEYKRTANGGGGGGAGQIWMGEIDVTPKQTISINIGNGGSIQSNGGKNGNDGNPTSIIVGGTTYSVSGGKGGKFEEDNTYISTTGGLGGGLKTTNFSSSARYKNWANLNESAIGGKNGNSGNTIFNGAGGGNGGTSYKLDGTAMNGGNGGGAESNGINAASDAYGAGGGGGGGGGNTTFGTGGKGANGYVYIEWGGTNGSGGTAGEFTQTLVTHLDGEPSKRVMKIRIGRGGGINGIAPDDNPDIFSSSTIGSNGNGGETSITISSGGKTVVHKARGGLKGNNGTMDENIHGELKEYPDTYSKLYKEYIQSGLNTIIASGQEGNNEYGGMGGYLSCLYKTKDNEGNTTCTSTIKSNDGSNSSLGPIRPGCGGTSILSPLYEPICNITNTSASSNGNNGIFGGGGGGGAVLNKTGGIGGNGGNGFVILEYKSTKLD